MRFIFFLYIAFMLSTIAANANVMERQAQKEHMQYCVQRGGHKNICACSYEKAKAFFRVEELIDLNRRIDAGIGADPEKVKLFAKITARCAKEVERQAKNSKEAPVVKQTISQPNRNPLAIPVPLLPGQEPIKQKQPEPPAEKDLKESQEQTASKPRRLIGDRTNVSEQEYLNYVRANNKSDSVYFSEYKKVFFDSVARGDIQGLIAGAPLVKNYNMLNEQDYTPLMVAALYGQPLSAQFLIDKRAKVRFKNKQGQTALHIAAFAGQPEIVELLLSKKAKIDESYGPGYQPIHLAALKGNIATISALLAAGADINAKMEDGSQPIHLAILSENPQLIGYLLKNGANINAINNIGQTPLILASQENKPLAVQTLLAFGANSNAIDALGKSAITVAKERKNNAVLGVFLTYQEKQRLRSYGITN